MIFCCSAQLLQLTTYLHDKILNNFEIVLSEQAIRKVQIYHQHTVRYVMVYSLHFKGYEDKIAIAILAIASPHCNCI